MEKVSKNVQVVLNILKTELGTDVTAALKLLTSDYSMTWVYQGKSGQLFPRSPKNFKPLLKKVYKIQGRKHDIKNIAEGKNIVMVELIESYPNPKTGKVYRTPLVIVCELERGKIKKGRHYCDPRLSYLYLSEQQITRFFTNFFPSPKTLMSSLDGLGQDKVV